MSATYQIQVPVAEPVDTEHCTLYIDIGPEHLLHTVLNQGSKEFIVLQYFNLDKYNAFNQFREIVYHNQWLMKTYNKVNISYNFSGSILLPEWVYKPGTGAEELNLIYGDLNTGVVFTDHLSEWGIFNTYRVPVHLHEILKTHFVDGRFFHVYSLMLHSKKATGFTGKGSEISLAFYNNKLICIVMCDAKLMLIQTFEYDAAEDVSYHLLNIAGRFDINCETVQIIASGLIDEQSVLFTELKKYFVNVTLQSRPDSFIYNQVFDEYPPHFFTPLFNFALCE
ncbi:MAG: DUF3822 family protein [Bacteroidetes bacterium]|nr:DUF3822 family protein [Bacteroidota bacterium]